MTAISTVAAEEQAACWRLERKGDPKALIPLQPTPGKVPCRQNVELEPLIHRQTCVPIRFMNLRRWESPALEMGANAKTCHDRSNSVLKRTDGWVVQMIPV